MQKFCLSGEIEWAAKGAISIYNIFKCSVFSGGRFIVLLKQGMPVQTEAEIGRKSIVHFVRNLARIDYGDANRF